MVASATSATLEFNNINPNMVTTNHKKPENFLEAISNRIRFSSNLNCARGDMKRAKEVKNSIFYGMGGPSLAAIIADVEAATKI